MFWRYLTATVIIIILGQTPLVRPLQSKAKQVMRPLQFTAYRVSLRVKDELYFLKRVRDLKNENRELGQKVLDLESQLTELKEIRQENQLLREQLQIVKEQQESGMEAAKLQLAHIIGRAPYGAKGEVVIDRGTDDGVELNDTVIYKNFLLGEIARVQKGSAVVRLTTDSSFRTTAIDQDSPTRSRGLVRGEFGTNLVLEKVLPNEQINPNDTIVTSGEDGKFRKGLVLGKVTRVLGKESEVFKTAQLELPLKVDRLEEIFVLKP
jgi:rod shape-determining protein MreC